MSRLNYDGISCGSFYIVYDRMDLFPNIAQRGSKKLIAATTSRRQPLTKGTNEREQNKQTNAREAHRPVLSFPSEMITMLNWTEETGEQRARQDST